MKFKFVWHTTSSWWVGMDWERVRVTKFNPVQEGWMFRLGFGFFALWWDKWRVLTPAEQEAVRNG
jgi:hypothetical protein